MTDTTDKFVTVLTTTHPIELAVIRSRLEAEGIACFIQDELTTQVNPFYSNAIGGAKLKVRESDQEAALEILKEGGYLKKEHETSTLYTKPYDKIKCPACGSEE